ncbi:thiamine phosphate synthase [Solibacillus sp. A46]|uniref:Thiamine phosphate synthase n=1 Tax=Solibacillus faecavium TaxID=2762221 RepID=A0ABR8XVX6_9BACL|nr:thiamine phosphate synthase [Solibacillus faecavium]MBD8036089.1 thiamine phosphate synthase [Solibacillus faecavium]
MKLMALTDDSQPISVLAQKIIQIQQIVDYIQIREKSKTPKEVVTLLEYLNERSVPKDKIIVNSHLDIAVSNSIPTVHLPEKGFSIKQVKEQFPHLKIGKSVHDYAGAKEAEHHGADYVLYGHCFETNSKKGKVPNGLSPINEMKKNLKIPVFAIGGIHVDRVQALLDVKADGIAVMSGIFSATHPFAAANQYREAIKDANKL